MNNIHTCSSIHLFGCPSHTYVSYVAQITEMCVDILRPFQQLGEVPGYFCQRHQQKQVHLPWHRASNNARQQSPELGPRFNARETIEGVSQAKRRCEQHIQKVHYNKVNSLRCLVAMNQSNHQEAETHLAEMLRCFTDNICICNIVKKVQSSGRSRTTQSVEAVIPEASLRGNFLIDRISVDMRGNSPMKTGIKKCWR